MRFMESGYFELVMLLIVAAVFGPTLWRTVLSAPFRRKKALRIVETGETAMSTIQSCSETGTYVNQMPELRIVVEVHPATGAPFQATKTFVIPSLMQLPYFQPGKQIQVSYDPADRSYIVLLLKTQTAAGG